MKRAVGALRCLLFDDSDKSFRNFSCVSVEFARYDSWCGGVNLAFTDGVHGFDICIPRKRDFSKFMGSRGLNEYSHWDLSDDPFTENTYIGEIGVGIYENPQIHDTVFSSVDIDETREFLKNLVHNFDEVAKEYKENYKNSYVTFTPLNINRYPSLSRMLKENGFEYRRR